MQLDRLGRRLQKFTAAGAFVWARGPLDFTDPARINNGTAVATGPGGEIFVTDLNRHRVAVYSGTGSLLRAFGTEGTADGQLQQPIGVAVDDGSAFVLDSGRADVQRFSTAGSFQGRFGASGGGPGEFLSPNGIAADRRGAIYVLDAGNSRVQTFGRDGSPRGSFGEAGTGPGQLDRPVAIAADSRAVVVSDTSGRVQRFVLPAPVGRGRDAAARKGHRCPTRDAEDQAPTAARRAAAGSQGDLHHERASDLPGVARDRAQERGRA